MAETEETFDAAGQGERRGKARRWIIIAALILVPLAVVLPPAVVLGPRLMLVNWIREHGRVGLEQASPKWLPDRVKPWYDDVFSSIRQALLEEGDIDSEDMRALAGLPNLKRLYVFESVADVPDPLLPAGGFSALRVLSLDDVSLSEEALTRIGRLPSLSSLSLYNVEARTLAPLADQQSPSMETLFIRDMDVMPAWLGQIGRIRSLRTLLLWDIELSSTAPFAGGGFKRLRRLDLAGIGSLSREDMAHIAAMPALEDLSFSESEVSAEGIKELAEAELGLQGLRLVGIPVEDDEIAAILKIRSLRDLSLFRSEITGAGLMRLGALPNLSEIDIRDTDVTDEGVKRFRKKYPGVQIRH